MKITNPFIVKLHYSFQTADKLYFVFDFVNGGDLYTYMVDRDKLEEDTIIQFIKKYHCIVRFYAAEILVALKALHEEGVIHRDLKPHNIMIDHEGHIKLIDFGLSRIGESSERNANSIVGTPNYIAPEILK